MKKSKVVNFLPVNISICRDSHISKAEVFARFLFIRRVSGSAVVVSSTVPAW